jgi:hypothetical protein
MSKAQKRTDTEIAQDWLDDMAYTVAVRDYKAHLDLFSKDVQLHGVPGAGVMHYDGWASRRRHELKSGLLFSLAYKELVVRSSDDDQITFDVCETMKSSEGHVLVLEKQVMLVREEKDRWRAKLERIHHHEMKII